MLLFLIENPQIDICYFVDLLICRFNTFLYHALSYYFKTFQKNIRALTMPSINQATNHINSNTHFIGRQADLALLYGLQLKSSASLVVVYGRRRIGKSRLIEEFGSKSQFYSFSGLYPEKGVTPQDQMDEFITRLKLQCPKSSKKYSEISDWSEAFFALAQETRVGKIVILLDELSWMAQDSPLFLSKLKSAWDLEFKKNPNLVLVLCSSVSVWVDQNLISNKSFYGRISLKLKLGELSLAECNQFWQSRSSLISDYDKLKILSVTGGVPKYLEEIRLDQSADDNIKQLCFTPTGLLFNDYDYIFSSVLEQKNPIYQDIVEALSEGPLQREALLEKLEKKSGGPLSNFLNNLECSGFITRDFTWDLGSGKPSKLSQYRLSDNYLRFYIKYILPNFAKIKKNQFEHQALSSLPGWTGIMGLQVENLVLHNRARLKNLLGIAPDDVLSEGPFFQRPTQRQKGCQIDYLIQTKLGVLYACEIKFTRTSLKLELVQAMKEKLARAALPKNISIIPALIHSGDLHDSLLDANFFARVISLSDFLI